MAKENIIPLQNFNHGGLADSRWSGATNSLYKITGMDPHTTPGLLKVAQKMTKISGTDIDEFCKEKVVSSNGYVYWFSADSGKIWEQKLSDNSFTLVLTTTAAAGEVKCTGAFEYNGYIYWCTESKLHRIASTNIGATNWAANKALNWATFLKTDKLFHPHVELNGVAYIGDAEYIAQIDQDTFTGDALDIPAPLRTKSLGKCGTELLIGTWVTDTITSTRIIKWNTYSVSFSTTDDIPETGINAFIPADNFVLVNAGIAGNLYAYDSSTNSLELYKTIPGDYSPTSYGSINPASVGSLNGQILMGFSNGSGNPADLGVYRIARHDNKYPYILDFPYPISERSETDFVTTNVEIGAIAVSGFNVFVAWKRTVIGTPDTYVYGIDKLDWSLKLDQAYIETRIMSITREQFSTVSKIAFAFYQIPTSCSLAFEYDKNYQGYVDMVMLKDVDRNIVTAEECPEASVLSIRITFTSSGNTSPSIESGAVFLE